MDTQKFRNQIEEARKLRAAGINNLDKCINVLSETVSSMSFLGDIRSALDLWLGPKHSGSVEKTPTVHRNTFILLCHVADLLSLKGHTGFYSDIYELMYRCGTTKNLSPFFWQSKRLTHALCASVVDEEIISSMSKHHEWINSIKKWKSSMKADKASKVGFRQCCSVLFPNSAATDCSNVTADRIKKTVSAFTKTGGYTSAVSSYISSSLYYDLSETLFGQGSMIEALLYARKALDLRTEIFNTKFKHTKEKHNKIKKFRLRPSVAIEAWPNDESSDEDDNLLILTPWNVLRCYLESVLQVGTILEIVGDAMVEDATCLELGKNISSSKDLPIFSVSFCTILGKIYGKQQCFDLAEEELRTAKAILDSRSSFISCSKCKLILEAKVEQQLGDLYKRQSILPKKDAKNLCKSAVELLKRAKTSYEAAIELLEHPVWETCVSKPKKRVSRNTVFCGLAGNDQDQKPKVTTKRLKEACDCGCEILCLSDQVSCWHCVPWAVVKSSSFKSFMDLRWECVRRRLLVNLWTEIGESLWTRGEIKEAHKAFLSSIHVLVDRSTFQSSKPEILFPLLTELIEKNIIGDMFAVEHATLLYNISWLSLRTYFDDDRRDDSCEFFNLSVPSVVSGLQRSLRGCCEVPETFQKVSQLLGVLYTLSASVEAFSLPGSSSSSLSVSRWASFFHQASIGANFNCKLFSRRLKEQEDRDTSSVGSNSLWLHRLESKSAMDPEHFIQMFFQGLPQATIICISILGEDYASWLSNASSSESTIPWIMISRLNSSFEPIVIAVPISSILTDHKKNKNSEWDCPWGYTIVDQIAPAFRRIVEDLNTASELKDQYPQWWKHVCSADNRLETLLRDMEDDWFGPWKDLLIGGMSEGIEDLLKRTKYGCYIGGQESIDDRSKVPYHLPNTITNADGDCIDKEAVISVLDLDIQMLPWENLSVLRDQEVYRVPSVATISYTCDKNCQFDEKKGEDDCSRFPVIDPSNAYYMVNPGGDLECLDAEAGWFRENIQGGIIGKSPGVDELRRVLQERQLFIYHGHGSGDEYISCEDIEKLERCATSLLMGCSSGSISLEGPYIPIASPLSYLVAGAPLVIANLWHVTTDIVPFTKAVLTRWANVRLHCPLSDKARIGPLTQARNMCSKKYFSGAAPVCYGVPTYICRKD